MGNFFKSLFSSSQAMDPEEEKRKKFDILKYDGIRAQKMGKVAYAIKCFTEALNLQEDFETCSLLASAYMATHRTEEALGVLDRMLVLEPEHAQTRLARVNLLFLLDRDADVVSDCQYILDRDQSNHLAWFMMGKAKRTLNDPLGAIADFTKAIALKEDFTDAYLVRAQVLLAMGQAQEALPDVEKAVELAPEEETTYLLRGQIQAVLGHVDAALADYQNTLNLNPFNEDATLWTAQLLMAHNRLDEAIAFLDEAIEMKPDFAKAYSERGRAKNLKGDKEGALADLKKAIELNPEGAEAQKLEGQHTNFDDMYKGGIF